MSYSGFSILGNQQHPQWEMTSLLCEHCLPANRAFQNRKSGCSTRSFFWFGKRSTTNGWNGKIRTVPGLQKQLQTALILSVTFIWSHPWVSLNGLWFKTRPLSEYIIPSNSHLKSQNFWTQWKDNLCEVQGSFTCAWCRSKLPWLARLSEKIGKIINHSWVN